MESICVALPDRTYQAPVDASAMAAMEAARTTQGLRRLNVLFGDGIAILLDSASRFSRCKSVRISAALW
jgi:hypothetical protein